MVAAVLQARACEKGLSDVRASLAVVCTLQPVRQGRRDGMAGLAPQQARAICAAYAPTLIQTLICLLCRTLPAVCDVVFRPHKLRSALCINLHGVVCNGGDCVVAQAWIWCSRRFFRLRWLQRVFRVFSGWRLHRFELGCFKLLFVAHELYTSIYVCLQRSSLRAFICICRCDF